MAKYLIKFSKKGYIKFTSHLDLIRLFKRCFKKADIKLMYSSGFNPHPKMAFAQPLSLGFISEGEVLEIETQESIPCEELRRKLQETMPNGIDIISCSIQTDGKSFGSTLDEAKYRIMVSDITISNESQIDDFFNQEEIIVKKRKKKKKNEFREINIKDKIRSWTYNLIDNNLIIETNLDAGSESNLNPDMVLTPLLDYLSINKDSVNVEITRLELKCK
ncbi:MAG: TIGR03936 family radical SAM-associated protein [Anaerovoracaceae bacterium]